MLTQRILAVQGTESTPQSSRLSPETDYRDEDQQLGVARPTVKDYWLPEVIYAFLERH